MTEHVPPDARARLRAETIADVAAKIESAATRHGRTPAEIAAEVIIAGFGGYERWPQPSSARKDIGPWPPA